MGELDAIRVLVGSPVKQKPEILKEFLLSLSELKLNNNIDITYFFIDDNNNEVSSLLLEDFIKINKGIIHKSYDEKEYICNEITHNWDEELIWRVAEFKNYIINKAVEDKYDYLFLVDSDLVLHHQTLEHLIELKKDIVSEIFWTIWEPGLPPLPQVWLSDQYDLFSKKKDGKLTEIDKIRGMQEFINKLKTPGVYNVGGLGACTLISKNALTAGVNYSEIENITFIGEDRHFCIRAVVLGFRLFVDTNYPAFHVYRDTDLKEIQKFKANY